MCFTFDGGKFGLREIANEYKLFLLNLRALYVVYRSDAERTNSETVRIPAFYMRAL